YVAQRLPIGLRMVYGVLFHSGRKRPSRGRNPSCGRVPDDTFLIPPMPICVVTESVMQQRKGGGEGEFSAAALNLSDVDLARAGELLTDLLRRFEKSLGTRPVMPRLDRYQLSELLTEPLPETVLVVASFFQPIVANGL